MKRWPKEGVVTLERKKGRRTKAVMDEFTSLYNYYNYTTVREVGKQQLYF